MTKQEFLDFASNQMRFNNRTLVTLQTTETILKEKLGEDVKNNFVIDFLYKDGFNGCVHFNRYEKNSNDMLVIVICGEVGNTFFRDDINQAVSQIAEISNCAGVIEKIFISEDGRFWDEHNELKAKNKEELFDYLANVEYDFHPIIRQRTYDILRRFGWYEGRNIDITEFVIQIEQRGIKLTEAQLNFLKEFSGLCIEFKPYYHNWEIYSLDYIIKIADKIIDPCNCGYLPEIYDGDRKIGENAIEIGMLEEGAIYLSSDARIFSADLKPLGRTALECLNHLANIIPENYEYFE